MNFSFKKNSIQQNYPPSLKQVKPLVQVSAVNIWFVFKNSIVQYHYILNHIQHHSISRIWETLKPRLHCEVDTFTSLNLYSPQWISFNLLPDRVGKEFELQTLGSFMCLCINTGSIYIFFNLVVFPNLILHVLKLRNISKGI